MRPAQGQQRIKEGKGKTTDGIIIVDKESGPSSFRIVERIKKIVGARKVGHAGTLDPFATGVLVIMLNQATKLSPFLMSQDKVYTAVLRLGIETDTHDLTGRVTSQSDVNGLTQETIQCKTMQFIGTIKQVPPPYSAIHYNGKRAYEWARSGVAVNLKEREVRIDYIAILAVDLPCVSIEVGCSSGTYIRTLVVDIGKSIGTGAHLVSLRRIKSGPYAIDDAVTMTQIAQCLSPDNSVNETIIPLKDALKGLIEIKVSDEVAQKIRNGYRPSRKDLFYESLLPLNAYGCLKGVRGQDLVAVLQKTSKGYDIKRVFV